MLLPPVLLWLHNPRLWPLVASLDTLALKVAKYKTRLKLHGNALNKQWPNYAPTACANVNKTLKGTRPQSRKANKRKTPWPLLNEQLPVALLV